MLWTNFPLFAAVAFILWVTGCVILFFPSNRKLIIGGNFSVATGIAVLIVFVVLLWFGLGRPPLRTRGETRLWYSVFISMIGYITYLRWNYKLFLAYSILMASLFLLINLLHPETYDKTLMPALQSPWFVPHVIVYILSYALLGFSFLVSIQGLYQVYFKELQLPVLKLADNLVYIGFAFLTFGLLFGALWAKSAWGNYWTWDPKETWALLTWMIYLLYIHIRFRNPDKKKLAFWMLNLAFFILLIAWSGINYLPSAQTSVHVYAK